MNLVVHRHVVILGTTPRPAPRDRWGRMAGRGVPDQSEQTLGFVACPRTGHTEPQDKCSACVHSRGVSLDLRRSREVIDCVVLPGGDAVVPRVTASSSLAATRERDVGSVMSRDVVCVAADASAQRTRRALIERAIGVLVVVDAGHRVLGLVTVTTLAEMPADSKRMAGDVMTTRPLVVDARTSLRRAKEIMTAEGVGHLAVVDGLGRLSGVVSSADLRT